MHRALQHVRELKSAGGSGLSPTMETAQAAPERPRHAAGHAQMLHERANAGVWPPMHHHHRDAVSSAEPVFEEGWRTSHSPAVSDAPMNYHHHHRHHGDALMPQHRLETSGISGGGGMRSAWSTASVSTAPPDILPVLREPFDGSFAAAAAPPPWPSSWPGDGDGHHGPVADTRNDAWHGARAPSPALSHISGVSASSASRQIGLQLLDDMHRLLFVNAPEQLSLGAHRSLH
jgi:hypothetical protein